MVQKMAVRIYRQNLRIRRSPCPVRSARDLVWEFLETGSTCDRPWIEWPSVSVEVAIAVHYTIAACPLNSARIVARMVELTQKIHSAGFCFLLSISSPVSACSHVAVWRWVTTCGLHKETCEGNRWLLRILRTDEAQFSLTGNVNTRTAFTGLTKPLTKWHLWTYMKPK